ncbi:MAG: AMP-binding protein [Bernardetiaceae bacterium]|nr:AMP-binding protein [Bernardetiaceae bacterium]
MESFFWTKTYPKGVPHEINPDKYDSLLDLFEQSIQSYKQRVAYENMGVTLTFEQVDNYSRDFAAYLQSIGIEKGDRVAVQMPNLMQYPIAVFGIMRAGGVVVNTNPLYTPHEMQHQFTDAGVKAVVILSNFASKLEQIIGKTDIEHVIVSEIGDMLGGFKGFVTNFVVKYVKNMVPKFNIPNATKLKDAFSAGKDLPLKKTTLQRDDIAFLQYTGGTTGVAKGAVLTHRNLIANMEQLVAWSSFLVDKDGAGHKVISALPLYHIFALTFNCLGMMRMGVHNILITNPRDMPGFVKELKNHQFSIISGVNTLFNALLNEPEFKNIDFSKLKLSLGGGMAVQDVVAKKWKETTGCPIAEAYGLTETSPGLTCNPLDGREQIGSIGLPLPSTEIRIADENDEPVPLGERGEIHARGPQVMRGYWNRDDETAKVFADDWFKTGDIGIMDEQGFVRIVDRKKEMILVSGFNVYPNEVENVIAAHPKVLEVGVIGVPDPKSNEAVKAFIVKKDNSLTPEEIIAFCKEELTGYKVPRHIEFRDELPKSNVGKILRRLLKEPAKETTA